MHKICVFTGTRAEYGILKPLMSALLNDQGLELQILVSGAHLSPEFGFTYHGIEDDGFDINEKIEILLSSDSNTAISKSVGLGLINFCDSLSRLEPDLLIILGDRFEAFAMATAAMFSRVPVAHLHGGEATFGVIDESIRHSITKMSHLHFTSTEVYRHRVIQLGENPKRVFNVGALGAENISNSIELLSRNDLVEIIGFSPTQPFILVTFHPVTLEDATAEKEFSELLLALAKFPEIKIIFTKANADTGGRSINRLIDQYVSEHPECCQSFISMGRRNYLSAMRYCRAVVGNSSSGIIEAPSFHIPTVNIGDRQQGRLQAESVINCKPVAEDIYQALNFAFAPDFQTRVLTVINPYEKADTTKRIIKVIRETDLSHIIKKEFYDIPFTISP